ncbi:glycoside hydrolase family 54 carbohydrate-binding module family 42 protein [Pseudocercospora fijiensis CIRAD86]|uniref:Alpha-L-arabinofuranosidase n=1 Tax=Pseudocercospora fijiensis (strain CIRAD86) TaxID=383855 RepID=M2ZWX6_PSEFD|nr:glycoside hydrolase family 54 carbohydrate-binding module family 42 protein [Pseudocercospora fijiensis CIRAD86]EME83499.1 glycoside hydrolase family 54 carbohydrate-binding module family 42 protein [Pseudocercospora fijiensis CIRAD86]
MSSYRLALSLIATSTLAAAGPCDIYASGNTPCVAAHSTTRALYNSFNGALYQVQRGSDKKTTDITPLSPGGVANAAAQDEFCASTTCVITVIYDQSGRNNHLTQAPPGGAANGTEANRYDQLASAIGAPVTLNGQKAYGVFVSPGVGYRIDATQGVATGDAAQGIYAIFDGTHYNDRCCFDYGNAEKSNKDTGRGHMEAIYFGTCTIWGKGAGAGPWIMADLEDGLFSGVSPAENIGDPILTYQFLTAIVKGEPKHWAIRGGNAASGSLSTYYNGPRPSVGGYRPMSKEGSIVLGVGGDNSNGAQGTFYEGAMTSGFPSDATENSVQSNIVAAKYAAGSANSGPGINVGSTVTLRATTPGSNTRYLAHQGSAVNVQIITSSSPNQGAAQWIVRAGLGNSACLSFESKDTPGSFIRGVAFGLALATPDGSKQVREDATFCYQAGLNGQGNSFRAWNYPTRFIRHYNDVGHLARNGGPEDFDNPSNFNNDVSWVVGSGFPEAARHFRGGAE